MSTPSDYADELHRLRSGAQQAFFGFDATSPAVIAALIQAHALHRLADALAPLERIAGALEAREPDATPQDATSTPQEPPQPASTTPGGHPLDQGGWIRSRVPTEEDRDGDGDVRVADRFGEGYCWLPWCFVAPGQPWAPADADPDSFSARQPLPAHLAYPTSDGWIHDRVPGAEDADQDGDVVIPARWKAAGFLHWSHVVPGQPWRPV